MYQNTCCLCVFSFHILCLSTWRAKKRLKKSWRYINLYFRPWYIHFFPLCIAPYVSSLQLRVPTYIQSRNIFTILCFTRTITGDRNVGNSFPLLALDAYSLKYHNKASSPLFHQELIVRLTLRVDLMLISVLCAPRVRYAYISWLFTFGHCERPTLHPLLLAQRTFHHERSVDIVN